MTVTDYEGFPIEGHEWPHESQGMEMVGYVSGWVTGDVTRSCADVYPEDEDYFGNDVLFICVAEGEYESELGDSGAPVFRIGDEGGNDLLGFHLGSGGGKSYFSSTYYTLGWVNQCTGFEVLNSDLCYGGYGPFEYRAPVFRY